MPYRIHQFQNTFGPKCFFRMKQLIQFYIFNVGLGKKFFVALFCIAGFTEKIATELFNFDVL